MPVFHELPAAIKLDTEGRYVVDARELIPKKMEYEVGGHYDKLKPGQTLKVIAHGDLRWLQKRLKMHRPGMFKVELSRDEAENAYVAIVERLPHA